MSIVKELNAEREEIGRAIVDNYGASGQDFVDAAEEIITSILHALRARPASELQDEVINDEGCDECHVGPGEPCLEVYDAVLDRAYLRFVTEVAEERS